MTDLTGKLRQHAENRKRLGGHPCGYDFLLEAADLIERHRNAHLISAAPDMYRALRELLSRIENDADAKRWFIEEQGKARAALAKADGEQQ